ncbi:hypothetical protein MSG28_005505 [Choristoneura fumiferana]|uniref:Uncharacterized protein n=1 Tax=Choristoneura fumiferana TaxID=7141 RepID=A0ACC0KZN4_CHOFU|nr:hypothetical protein MSG28_005505 [Choristoneura fumiferana]
MGVWPEVTTVKTENRHEIKLSGAAISKRISDEELNLKGNKLADKRLMKLVDQCRTKQVTRLCPRALSKADSQTSPRGKAKRCQENKKETPEDAVCDLCHSMKILYIEIIPNITVVEPQVGAVRHTYCVVL